MNVTITRNEFGHVVVLVTVHIKNITRDADSILDVIYCSSWRKNFEWKIMDGIPHLGFL